jgi:hypothetical protein
LVLDTDRGTQVCEEACHQHGSSTQGVCNLAPCAFREVLQNHLCRVAVDDLCYVYYTDPADSTSATCVEQCPSGYEEEYVGGIYTGVCVVTMCESVSVVGGSCGNDCSVYGSTCVLNCPQVFFFFF